MNTNKHADNEISGGHTHMLMINQRGDMTDEDEMEEALDNEVNSFLLGKDD